MQKNSHLDFILSPISNILRDVATASSGIGNGIETYPLCDYIMQSVFLRMTGFQEQKMKCIIWELATIDYEYRRILLGNDDKLGECSSYSDKNKIYKRLINQIHKYNSRFNIIIDIDKTLILQSTIADVENIFIKSNLAIWAQKSFFDFANIKTTIQHQHFANNNTNLFEHYLQEKYAKLYKHRNRCAHNTQSYQQNLPTLKSLANDEYKHDNYFVWFALLILIDKTFVELYDKYLELIEENNNR